MKKHFLLPVLLMLCNSVFANADFDFLNLPYEVKEVPKGLVFQSDSILCAPSNYTGYKYGYTLKIDQESNSLSVVEYKVGSDIAGPASLLAVRPEHPNLKGILLSSVSFHQEKNTITFSGDLNDISLKLQVNGQSETKVYKVATVTASLNLDSMELEGMTVGQNKTPFKMLCANQ